MSVPKREQITIIDWFYGTPILCDGWYWKDKNGLTTYSNCPERPDYDETLERISAQEWAVLGNEEVVECQEGSVA